MEIDASGVNAATTFLDGTKVGGTMADWQLCLEFVLRVRKTIAWFGFTLNLCKFKFLASSTAVLGFGLCKQEYILG